MSEYQRWLCDKAGRPRTAEIAAELDEDYRNSAESRQQSTSTRSRSSHSDLGTEVEEARERSQRINRTLRKHALVRLGIALFGCSCGNAYTMAGGRRSRAELSHQRHLTEVEALLRRPESVPDYFD